MKETSLIVTDETVSEAVVGKQQEKPRFTEVVLQEEEKPELKSLEATALGMARFEVTGVTITVDGAYPAEKLLSLLRGIVQLC